MCILLYSLFFSEYNTVHLYIFIHNYLLNIILPFKLNSYTLLQENEIYT